MRFRRSELLWACVALMCLAPAARAYVQIASNFRYPSPGNTVFNTLDVYVPDAGASSSTVTVILIHGGSYNGGDKSELTAISRRVADLGYVAVNINYTLAWFGPSFPQAVQDVYNVIAWVRGPGGAQANLPDKIVVVGVSAGATIGSTAALAADVPNLFGMPTLQHPRGYQADGLIHIFGRADLVWNVQTYGQIGVIVNYLGTQMQDPASQALYAYASAITYVNPCSPPTVLYHATNDPQVPVGNSMRLSAALTAANVPSILNLSNAGHSMAASGGDPGTADNIAAAIPWMLTNGQPGCGRQGPPTGACCTATSCTITPQAGCGGLYMGNSTVCEPEPCVRGACCTSLTCTLVLPGDCDDVYLGDGTTCTPDTCPRAACCTGAGSCAVALQVDCTGFWLPGATACEPTPCPLPSACCNLAAGSCTLTYEPACTGTWIQSAAACQTDPCPYPGACCAGSVGACVFVTQAECAAAPGTWTAPGTSCAPNPCPQPGACCIGTACAPTLQADCTGLWSGPNTLCSGNPCTQALACCTGGSCTISLRDGCGGVALAGHTCTPTICDELATPGVCCRGVTCAVKLGIDCAGSQRLFLAGQTTCNQPGNQVTPCCIADFNKDNGVTVQDLFEFLAAWFANSSLANVVTNGVGAPTVESLFRYLGAWFNRCPAP